ncbi:MAG TPA: helix-turn-helix transcriptional regulator [Candidatus Merdivicinus intestinigallinarum]|nr:helix-turn-helix transcriptional regulator [Candidatus Merdivicinus intestinigallinarum]
MEKNGLGKRINSVRKDRGLTADKLSEMCSINATYLRQIEGGVKVPSLPVFIDICNALKISPDYLLQEELAENEISMIREIEAIWKTASPSKQALALAMLKAVLEYEEP